MQNVNIPHTVKIFSEIADDYFYDVLTIKEKDVSNHSLVFLHAHTLELSAKTACLKLGIDISKLKNGHDIVEIYNLLQKHLPKISPLIPTPQDLIDYKKFWIPGDAPTRSVYMPAQKDTHKLELAYFVDNAMNLKYAFTKGLVQVSQISLHYEGLNPNFLLLFNICRQTYSSTELNKRLTDKIFNFFGETADSEARLQNLLNILTQPA